MTFMLNFYCTFYVLLYKHELVAAQLQYLRYYFYIFIIIFFIIIGKELLHRPSVTFNMNFFIKACFSIIQIWVWKLHAVAWFEAQY